MKKILTLSIFLFHGFVISFIQAQVISVASGTTFQISAGSTFQVNGLTLVPSSDFDLDGLSITKNSSITNTAGPTSVSRYYLFSGNTPAYSGTVQVNYEDAELNGLAENLLEVNNYNGSAWTQTTSATNDATNNYVLSNSFSGVTLREIALASSAAPLPVTWLSFTATKQGNDVMLNWSTAQEMNSLDYVVQHRLDATQFTDLNIQAAAGNSSTSLHYNYLHTQPFVGLNYYRIKQRDFNGDSSFSAIRHINFSLENTSKALVIIGNPIQSNDLQIVANRKQDISLYNLVGQLFWEKHFDEGTHSIDISQLASGAYFLRTNTNTIKILKP